MDLLVKKAIKGDKEALLQLVMKEKDNYYKLAFAYMKNANDAMDMLQEMIVVLYKEIHTIKKHSSFYSWSKTILVNLCKKQLSKNIKIDDLDLFAIHSQSDEIHNTDNKIYLDSLIENLNEDQKEAITLRYYLDYSYDEISNITGAPLGTIKSRISKGISKLKVIVGGEL